MSTEQPEIYWESSEKMDKVDDGRIQSVITSPPYYDLKDYGHENQIGLSDSSYEEYHSRLKNVWEQCYQKLSEDGTLWVVADTTMSRGDLRLIPQDIKKHAQDVGFQYQDTIIWYKPTSLGGLNSKNLVNKKEYIIVLSKSDTPKLYPERNTVTGAEDPAVNDSQRLGNLWRFPVKRGSLGKDVLHKAPYPVDLVKRIVEISTNPGDYVLDPFMGSGTTASAALELNRNCIGYEINEEFKPVIQDRISEVKDPDGTLVNWS